MFSLWLEEARMFALLGNRRRKNMKLNLFLFVGGGSFKLERKN